ncbi:MAG: hypothetical protein WB709_12525 [Solirubrobacteraceae bacterium]
MAVVFLGLAVSFSVIVLPACAGATRPSLLWQTPEDGIAGAGAGQLDFPFSLAVNASSGHIYAADIEDARIDEFTAWGAFVKAWGWGVRDGSTEMQVCGPEATPPSVSCSAGIEGSGPGQFSQLRGGVAVDSAGRVYVGDIVNHRVERFDGEGHFELMIGGGVDKGPNHPGNLCTEAFILGGDTCGAGTAGEGNGQFTTEGYDVHDTTKTVFESFIAVGPDDHLFVGDVSRIQEFDANGAYVGTVDIPGKTIRALAVDGAGNFYTVFSGVDNVHKWDSSGAELGVEFSVAEPTAVAVNATGDVFAKVETGLSLGQRPHVVEFDAGGGKLIPDKAEEEVCKEKALLTEGCENFAEAKGGADVEKGLAVGDACGLASSDVYIAHSGGTEGYVLAYGPAPDPAICPQPKRAPEIGAQYAVAANADGALLRAKINPRSASDVTYYVEYGTGRCSKGGCVTKVPSPPGEALGEAVNFPVTTKGVFLSGLQPSTVYHFRFVAQSSGSGGEPVRGVGGEVGKDGTEGSFVTPAVPAAVLSDPCPNAAFRAGFSASLADCRAYEMVSPVDKNGGGLFTLLNTTNDPAGLNQSTPDGEKLTYSAFASFADAQSASYATQYVAGRDPKDGWFTHAISPPRGIGIAFGLALENEFFAFSGDLCEAWLLHNSDLILGEGAAQGYPDIYRRQNCGKESYAGLTPDAPPTIEPENYAPETQGISADGEVMAFRVADRLTKNAASGVGYQCYESSSGVVRLISVLPVGGASKEECSIGTANEGEYGTRADGVHNAVSMDGSRIFWTASERSGLGRIYVRIDHKNPTVAVSEGGEGLSGESGSARFLTAAADGSKAVYSVGQMSKGAATLYEFDVADRSTKLVAGRVKGLMGASEDASRLYFISEEALGGANAEGHSASPGEPNLYFDDSGAGGGAIFIATLSPTDAVSEGRGRNLSPVETMPYKHTAWVNSDGLNTVFMSTARLTGFDNADAQSGEADTEIYLYDAIVGKLVCVSCNPTGVAPSGRELLAETGPTGIWGAAQIPAAENEFHAPRVLSNNGRRLFFESYEALVERDTNGMQDVYEWEAAGEGDCTLSSAAYSPPNGGCLTLISSGQSPADSTLVDSSADGRDVFFNTDSTLVSGDPGQVDIYDARAGGGFPAAQSAVASCQGEACQGAVSAPLDQTPASALYSGPGDITSPLITPLTVKPKAKPLTAAQKLKLALRACHARKNKHKRAVCETEARRRYSPQRKSVSHKGVSDADRL